MNRYLRIWTVVLILAASALLASRTVAAPLVMTIDNAASSLTLDGQLGVFPFLEQAPGSKTTRYTGTITVDVDSLLSPSTISILSGAADADINGVWLPKIGGQLNNTDAVVGPAADADYGVKAQFMNQDAAFAAARGLVLDVSAGPEVVGGGGMFNSTETLTVLSGFFDAWVHPSLGGLDPGDGRDDTTGDIYPRDPAFVTQSSYVVVGDTATLTIPVRALRVDDGDFTAFAGTLVATARIPEPSTFLLIVLAAATLVFCRRN